MKCIEKKIINYLSNLGISIHIYHAFSTNSIYIKLDYANYRKMLSQELLRLKAEGMPATIAYDIARGKEEIANAKEQEIITECLYKSCQEAINTYKLQIKILQEQINKEMSNG